MVRVASELISFALASAHFAEWTDRKKARINAGIEMCRYLVACLIRWKILQLSEYSDVAVAPICKWERMEEAGLFCGGREWNLGLALALYPRKQ
jgi:hypothetical protein